MVARKDNSLPSISVQLDGKKYSCWSMLWKKKRKKNVGKVDVGLCLGYKGKTC